MTVTNAQINDATDDLEAQQQQAKLESIQAAIDSIKLTREQVQRAQIQQNVNAKIDLFNAAGQSVAKVRVG
jgi:hypothetical protein